MVIGCDACASETNRLSTVEAPTVLLVDSELAGGTVTTVELDSVGNAVPAGAGPGPHPATSRDPASNTAVESPTIRNFRRASRALIVSPSTCRGLVTAGRKIAGGRALALGL
jgi:hypothetical protein